MLGYQAHVMRCVLMLYWDLTQIHKLVRMTRGFRFKAVMRS